MTSALLSLIAFSAARAQRATQVVRYSITAVSQGNISRGSSPANEPSSDSATAGFSAYSPTPTGFASPDAPSAASGPARSTSVTSTTRDARSASASSTVTPAWQASYAITNNESNKKLTVSLDEPMPDGMELIANISAPAGAEAKGPVDLGTAGTDVVTAIGVGSTPQLSIDFAVSAPTGSHASAGSRKVTFTFISGA